MKPKHKAFIAIGANIGDLEANLKQAIDKLNILLADLKVSNFITTKPVGYTSQPDFLNSAVSGFTDLQPEALLKALKKIEKEVGRKPSFRWGPRKIDLDIIFYDNLVYKSDLLEIPHPRAHLRDFVLKPILELDTSMVFPNLNKSVWEVLNTLENNRFSPHSFQPIQNKD